jgi:hypothetical protein
VSIALLDDLRALAARQAGVVTRGQLAAVGVRRDKVRAEIAARRWRSLGYRVVALHNGPLDDRAREWAAVLDQPGPAALAGLTAARAYGLEWSGDARVHVVVPHGTTPRGVAGCRIHVSRRFSPSDVHPTRTPPQVRVERGLVDAASWSVSKRVACGLLAAAVQQRLTTAPRLRAELLRAGLIRHRALLLAILADIAGGAESLAEIDLSALARRAGLPPPQRQSVRTDRSGHRRYLDAEFDGFSVEIDGAVHLLPLTYWDDMARQNDLLLVTGTPILRFSSVALRVDPAAVVAQLAAARRRWS